MNQQPPVDPEVTRGWNPISPLALPSLLKPYGRDWWLAGGWAFDTWLGHPTRIHEDTDIQVFRDDLIHLLESLPDWIIHLCQFPPDGSFRRWHPNEPVPEEVHDIWCRHTTSDRWQLQIMVLTGDDDTWYFRRDPRISGSRAAMGWRSGEIPVLAPEIQLLYKVKTPRRPKDDLDLRRFIPRLSRDRRLWLEDAVDLLHPEARDFIKSL